MTMDGILIIDKPRGKTSMEVDRIVKRLTGQKKVGHLGTLDPLATGVLPVFLGKATKTIPFFEKTEKEYQVELTFGAQTRTGDSEGEVISTSDHRVAREDLERLLPRFQGEIEQIPPMFSAIHVNGKRLYDLARASQVADRPARKATIHRIELLDFVPGPPEWAVLRVTCSKGTYMRTLCEDIAQALGTVGHQSALRRLRSGVFSLDQAITMEELEKKAQEGTVQSLIQSPHEFVKV